MNNLIQGGSGWIGAVLWACLAYLGRVAFVRFYSSPITNIVAISLDNVIGNVKLMIYEN